MRALLLGFLAFLASLALASAQSSPTSFTGAITDSECADANHANMRMGETDRDCATACVDAHGASYVLWDGKRSYALSDQKAPAAFVGRRVTVVGTLDESSTRIVVRSISAAN